MFKELLLDFLKVFHPSYRSDSFRPYFSRILAIMTITFLAYGLQVATGNIYTYANNPASFKTKFFQTKFCHEISNSSLPYVCRDMQTNAAAGDNATYLFSAEHDLHKLIN